MSKIIDLFHFFKIRLRTVAFNTNPNMVSTLKAHPQYIKDKYNHKFKKNEP
jgi:hypothetical protein